MRSRVGVLVACTFGLWAVAFLPARYFEGENGVVYSLVALGLCIIPTSLTLIWAQSHPASAQQQILLVFGGTGLRMIFVIGGGFGLSALLPYFREAAFWSWLLVFYLFTLAVEVILLRKDQATADRS